MRIFGRDNGINVVEIAPGIVRRMTDAEVRAHVEQSKPAPKEQAEKPKRKSN